ncbi:MAG TPA: class I SAM-dependent methyltransferase [Solirubrobacteraceae bacterium]|nr:class I SAM-dependent methyltransferase [Solirubrobacteraceae bacterium]
MSEPEDFFGEDVAAAYDESVAQQFTPAELEQTAAVLAHLAGSGAALELGIGTGRVAVPLAERGVAVTGIDLSRAMVERLRTKPGGHAIPVTIGDFATRRVPGEFSLVYLVFNTIMNVTTQAGQTDCFRNAAAHLRPGGSFLVECMVPGLRLLPPGQSSVPFAVGPPTWAFDVYEPATQAMSSNYLTIEDGETRHRSIPFRYVWPAELDLMAEIAGMHLTERWEDWARSPFTAESTKQISVWQKPSGA